MPGYGTLSMAWEVAGSKRARSRRGARASNADHQQIRGHFSEAGVARPIGGLAPADSGPWALRRPVVTGALPAVSWRIVWTAWSPQPLVLLVSADLLVWYLRLARQLAAEWPRSRTWSWCVGIASFVWVGSGFPQVYDRSLYWVWTAQQLAFLLVLPVLLMAGHPIALNPSRCGDRSCVNRLLGTGPVRLVSSPLVGPLLVQPVRRIV